MSDTREFFGSPKEAPDGYHSTPVCGYDHGSRRPERCQCPKFEPLELARLQARLAEVETERDAYMQAAIDTFLSSVEQAVERALSGEVSDGR